MKKKPRAPSFKKFFQTISFFADILTISFFAAMLIVSADTYYGYKVPVTIEGDKIKFGKLDRKKIAK